MALTGYQGMRLGTHTTDATISAATTITPETDADSILLQAFTQNVRVTLDGTTPTATTGFQIVAGGMMQIDIGPDTVIKVIEETASASIQWQCFRSRKDTNA